LIFSLSFSKFNIYACQKIKHDAAAISFCTLIVTMSQQYISQTDVSEDGAPHGSDLLSGSHPIKVIVYKADTPLPVLTTGIRNNYTVELHIGEREKIGQGTFGYRILN
jgi:hypothetical protein